MCTDCLDRTSRTTDEHSNYRNNAQNTIETLHFSKCYNLNMKEQYLINANKSDVCDNYDTVIGLLKKLKNLALSKNFNKTEYKTSLIRTWLI